MNGLFDAEIEVNTVSSIKSGAAGGALFYLADYGSMIEFTSDCAARFPDENTPVYVFTSWSGIPDFLISRTWLCPNIFDIRDAIQMLDEDSIERFPHWCRINGHDITTEDPMQLVTRYQDYISPVYEPDPEIPEPEDWPCVTTPYILAELGIGVVDIFNNNFNE